MAPQAKTFDESLHYCQEGLIGLTWVKQTRTIDDPVFGNGAEAHMFKGTDGMFYIASGADFSVRERVTKAYLDAGIEPPGFPAFSYDEFSRFDRVHEVWIHACNDEGMVGNGDEMEGTREDMIRGESDPFVAIGLSHRFFLLHDSQEPTMIDTIDT